MVPFDLLAWSIRRFLYPIDVCGPSVPNKIAGSQFVLIFDRHIDRQKSPFILVEVLRLVNIIFDKIKNLVFHF